MKLALIFATLFAVLSLVLAEDGIHYFSSPGVNAEYTTSDSITFTTNDISNDDDETIIAKLYNAADNTEIKQIGSYTGAVIVRASDKDDFSFNWVVDVPPGTYYVRLYEQDADGGIDDDDEEDNEVRSFDFAIREPSPFKRKRGALRRRALMRNMH
ncbi:uncharacterized protein B0P05DRAFT_587434 [Gilbertella persicaria]|uniref:uncharacterized protein n=1 Tax=Gilbertella persicaria TaxID=101096 RepID=UPI0022200F7F|nr:uncharacterized protein B0P05DRAFT_587434 [Gilbertella persicaria]KAI8078204.1 hypothetical protein B0P05DRAFT_587434 [Gilbertella persicaria]